MSRSASRLSRKARTLCDCGHRAVFFRRSHAGVPVGRRRDHPLCFRCWRAARSSERAREMAAAHARRLAYVPGPFALV
jgi:hypothetical protein